LILGKQFDAELQFWFTPTGWYAEKLKDAKGDIQQDAFKVVSDSADSVSK